MPDIRNGFITTITGPIIGLIVETMLRGFVDACLISPLAMFAYQVLSIVSVAILVHTTKYWGTLYLLGWWFGLYINFSSGLVGILEFIVDSIILGVVLVTRFMRRFDD